MIFSKESFNLTSVRIYEVWSLLNSIGLNTIDEWEKLNGLKVCFMKPELHLPKGALIWIQKS